MFEKCLKLFDPKFLILKCKFWFLILKYKNTPLGIWFALFP